MNVEYYIDLINEDIKKENSYDRYPVRFLSMNYDADTSTCILQLRNRLNNTEIIDLKSFIQGQDGWLTIGRVIDKIKNLDKSKSYLIIGFSEYARFLNTDEFITLIISLLEIENTDQYRKRRLIIPCFALYSLVKKTISEYHARKVAINPLLNETDIEDLPRVYFLDQNLSIKNHSNEINSSSEWFGLWRNPGINVDRPILCTSETLSFFYSKASPDNVYNIKHLRSYCDILQYMYGISGLFPDKNNEEKYYKDTIDLLEKNNTTSFEKTVISELNVQSIDLSNVYSVWKNINPFRRWLLKNYIIRNFNNGSYLKMIFEKLTSFSEYELIDCVYTNVFELKEKKMIDERRLLLSSIKKNEKNYALSNAIIKLYFDRFNSLIKKTTSLSYDLKDFESDDDLLIQRADDLSPVITNEFFTYFTDNTVFERKFTIWLFRNQLIKKELISEVYPLFSKYIDNYHSNVKYAIDVDNYLNIYRNARFGYGMGDIYETELLKYNSNSDSFYSWYLDSAIDFPETHLYKQEHQGNTYVLDGVGAEYIGLLYRLLEEKGCNVTDLCYCKCHLPSITEMAKNHYPDSFIWDYSYDKNIIHGSFYYPISCLENSLSEISNMVDSIVLKEGKNAFAITADHGATVGHKIKKKDKKYNYSESDHDGRCWKNVHRKPVEDSNDYIKFNDENDNEWIIALNQQSLYNSSKYMVHGGATPEEVLIPLIIANKEKKSTIDYTVKPINLAVSGLQKRIEFSISPTLGTGTKAFLRSKDGTYTELQYDKDNDLWYGELNRGIKQKVEVLINNNVYTFETKPSTKMGDDLFDE